jgi:hypothetical protein
MEATQSGVLENKKKKPIKKEIQHLSLVFLEAISPKDAALDGAQMTSFPRPVWRNVARRSFVTSLPTLK